MFAPTIPVVAVFGDVKDVRSWSRRQVVAFDDDGQPWVVDDVHLDRPEGSLRGSKNLRLASEFSNYLGLKEGYGDHNVPDAAIVPASAGWRAAYAWIPTTEDAGTPPDAWVLPVVAWKRRDRGCGSDTELLPIVPTNEDGRQYIDVEDQYTDEPTHVAIYGPGEDVPNTAEIIALAKKQQQERPR